MDLPVVVGFFPDGQILQLVRIQPTKRARGQVIIITFPVRPFFRKIVIL